MNCRKRAERDQGLVRREEGEKTLKMRDERRVKGGRKIN